ncbi:DnaJ domain-containing protein [Catalinimonas alkaloidigena]|uniref:DnaJ domain-containing protein n=1 Tax=Catalinimonas alkaloidigena TaxID=1075417 RepID=A0A1G9B317_9BACT|nr:J domain-containing protein [Catalinimonas alkaloidigena]SDK33205.1 DnaJ domain-containing protein [Catalinimonas alkaloidigena]
MRDRYYHILGVSAGADRETIRRAYRRKVMQLHPDLNASSNAQEQFIALQEAYEHLVSNRVYLIPDPPVSPFEKYRYVYSAPTDPYEYAEWIIVARARGQEQARQRYQDFLLFRENLKQRWYYIPAKISTWAAYFLCFVLGFLFASLPLVGFAIDQEVYPAAVVCTPFAVGGFWIFRNASVFKKSVVDVYFKD